MKQLENLDLSLVHSMIPLVSLDTLQGFKFHTHLICIIAQSNLIFVHFRPITGFMHHEAECMLGADACVHA